MVRIYSWKAFFNRRGYATSLRGGMRYLFGKRGQRLVRGLRLYYRLRMMVMLRTDAPISKLTRGRDVRIWVNGNEAFPRLERLIRKARFSIVIQMFIWKDDPTGRRIARLLLEAADRGVMIDITKEAVGDFFEFRGDFLSTQNSVHPIWQAFWKHPRIRISHDTHKDHAKVYVIDDQWLLLTGMNIANEYRYGWHDYMVELRGQHFVEQFLTRQNVSADSSLQLVMNTEDRKEIRSVLMKLLSGAKESVVVEHCYVSDPEVVQTLIDLSKRGVRLTLILPKQMDFHHHSNLLTIGRILAEGKAANVKVFIYPDIFHAKLIMVDHETLFIGSANLYTDSIDEMGEVNVLIRGHHRALWKTRETLREDILLCRPLSGPPPLLWLSRWLAWLGL